MNRNIIKIFLLVTLAVLLVGIASASDPSTDTTSTPATDVSTDTTCTDTADILVEDTTSTSTNAIAESVPDKQPDNKIRTKEEKNVKTANEAIKVGNYDQLCDAYSSSDATVTINITGNITLQANPTLGSNIKNLRIEGNGFTINGANQYQFLRIPSATKVTINNISIINCYNREGSVIYNNGTVIIRNSNLTNNTARWDGSVIYNNAGIANISGSNLNYNNAEFGGAIYNNEGNLIIIGSNLNYNTARNNGGAIYKINGNLTIVASYFNNNNATGDYGVGGAIYNDGGNLSVTGCDFNNNNANYRGGAIYNTGSDTSSNIVLSTFNNNYPPNFRINNENEQFSIELNLNDGFIDVDTVAVYLDNKAECVYTGPLDGYAVPLGYIIRLVVNGSNINSFHNNTFIIRPASNVEVNNYSELVTAVNNAKSLDYDEYYISLSQGDYNATTGMTWGDASGTIRKLIIIGNGITLDGNNSHQFMQIKRDYTLTLKYITLTNYKANVGGAIYNFGNLNISSSNFTHNAAINYGEGGAINNRGSLNITDSNFSHNTAYSAGAIYSNETLSITSSNFTQNIAEKRGGAIENYRCENATIIMDCNFNNNTSRENGSAISIFNCNITIIDCNFTHNTAEDCGGAVYNDLATIIITDSNIIDNIAGYNGGGIYNKFSNTSIITSNLNKNNAMTSGGAIYNYCGNMSITYSNLSYNSATYSGGAIRNIGGAIINNNTFTNNLVKTETEKAIIDEGLGAVIENNTNDDSSKYGSTIYTDNIDDLGYLHDVTIAGNTFVDEPLNTSITISADNTSPKINNTITFTIILNDSFGSPMEGQTILLITNENTTTLTTNQSGQATQTYTPTTSGKQTITVKFEETAEYRKSEDSINITVLETKLTVDPINSKVGNTINITARIQENDETLTSINSGKVTFKVNGKTLKDASGKVIYVKVVNGTATIENYVVPTEWTRNDTTIQAIYSGSAQCSKLTSEKTQPVISPMAPSITTNDITATAGEQITLTANINDGDKQINTGKVLFKINGKTIKDASGKVIYVKVVNGIASLNYTIPSDMNTKNYNITAIFTSPNYEKLEDSKTLTVN